MKAILADIAKVKEGEVLQERSPFFGRLKRGGRVHAVMIPDVGSRMLMSVIRKKIRPVSIVYSDAWHAYRMLDISEFRHERINHAKR